MKNIFLTILLIITAPAYGQNLSGHWVWEENSKDGTFSLKLTKVEKGYKATYCAVAMGGRRIDCPSKFNKNEFLVVTDGSAFEFTTNYSNSSGEAKVTRTGTKLSWKITQSPDGEYFAPDNAILKKYK